MAQVFGERSKYLMDNDFKYFSIGGFFLICLFLLIIIFRSFATRIASVVAFVVVFFIIKYIIEKCLHKSDNYHNGRKAEYEICDELQKLPGDYLIFQDAKLPDMKGANIDFVVVGSSGIYAIEVKSQLGKIKFEKTYEKNFLNQAMNGAMSLHDYLGQNTGKDFFVTPILVFSRASARFGLTPVNRVYVIGKAWLNELILKGKDKLFPEEVETLKAELLKMVKIIELRN